MKVYTTLIILSLFPLFNLLTNLLTIIPPARMGSESIAHEVEWATESEAMRARGIIDLVNSN